MKIKGPVGRCRYCDQQFMSRAAMVAHEQKRCPERPAVKAEHMPEPETDGQIDRTRWRQVIQGGRSIGWVRQ